jgi:hypothetical protein
MGLPFRRPPSVPLFPHRVDIHYLDRILRSECPFPAHSIDICLDGFRTISKLDHAFVTRFSLIASLLSSSSEGRPPRFQFIAGAKAVYFGNGWAMAGCLRGRPNIEGQILFGGSDSKAKSKTTLKTHASSNP